VKTAGILKRRRLTSLGRLLGNPGFALCIAGVMGGACSTSQNRDSVATVNQEATAPSGSVLINEVLYDPKGQGTEAYQYIEISGPPGDTLDGYYVAIVDGSAANAGDVLAVVDLGTACSGAPCALGTDGLLMITPELTGGQIAPAGTTQVAFGYTMVNTTGTGDAENDISILVIESPTTDITTSTNLAPDAGPLALPEGATLSDGIGWREDTTGTVFGADVKPNTAAQDSPSAIVRISTCTTANTAACWFYGEFANAGTGAARNLTGITASVAGTTLPADVTSLTPGAANVAAAPNDAGVGGGTSTGGAAGQGGGAVAGGAGGTSSVDIPGTKVTGGSTAVSTGTTPVGGSTATSTSGTTPAGGTTGASTAGTTPAGDTTVASTTGTSAAGDTTAASTGTSATGGATAVSTAGTKATGGRTGTSTSGTKTGGGTAIATTNTSAGSKEDDSGCGCRTAGKSQVPASGLAFMAALAGGLLARRRRRS
jgi:MYXO-CTERM domain-containing protein